MDLFVKMNARVQLAVQSAAVETALLVSPDLSSPKESVCHCNQWAASALQTDNVHLDAAPEETVAMSIEYSLVAPTVTSEGFVQCARKGTHSVGTQMMVRVSVSRRSAP